MNPTHPGILAKTLLLISLSVCGLTAGFIAFSYGLVVDRFQSLESEETSVNLERVVRELENKLHRVESSVSDWAPWDETAVFIQQLNDDYKDKNLRPDPFQTLDLNFMLFFNAAGSLVHSQFHNLDTGQAAASDPAVIQAIQALPPLFRHASAKDQTSGMVVTPTGMALVASAPIVTSTFEGPILGTLVFGRYLDKQVVAQISAQTQLAVRTHAPLIHQQLFTEAAVRTPHAPLSRQFAVRVADGGTVNGYALINDLADRPGLVFEIAQERKLFRQGVTMWRQHALFSLLLGLVFILVLVVLLNRGILRHLTRLTSEVGAIAVSGRHDGRVTVSSQDEIGELAIQINTMLESLHWLQRQREDNERHLQTIIDSIHCGIMIVDAENRHILSINRTGAAMLNRSPEAVIGQVCHQFACPQQQHDCPVLDRGEQVDLSERSLLRADNSLLPVLKSVAVIEKEGRQLLIESFIDISGLKQAQEKLRINELKYRQFFDDDLTGKFLGDIDGQILDCNRAFAEMLGYQEVNEVKGVNFRQHYFIAGNRADKLQRLTKSGKLIRDEEILRHRDGSPIYCIGNIVGEFDEQGQLIHIRGYVMDDTKRVLLEQEVRQAQKLEAIGTMAGGIAHDFNNILAGIMGYAELILRDLEQQPQARHQQLLRNILSAGERARALIHKILTFSRQAESEPQPIRLQQTIDDAVDLIRASLPSTIAIEHRSDSRATVLADPIQIHQVFMNLCTNAGHAMKESGGTLTISLEDVTLDSQFTSDHPELRPGEYVRVEVSDSGEGIPEHLLGRIFDPFFTTKKKGEGTGLGLAMVHGIVSSMHGLIQVVSQPGQGTRFTIHLPIVQETGDKAPAAPQTVPTGSEHVVYVDDEEFLVDIGTEILRGLGYLVTGFTDSDLALGYLLAHEGEVDLVISDMTMPKLTGLDLARNLQELDAPPPVIICTGHNEGMTTTDLAPLGVREMLLKPITVNKLAEAVRRVLDAGA